MLNKTLFVNLLLGCITLCITVDAYPQSNKPAFLLLDGDKLATAKKQYQAGDAVMVKNINTVITDAGKALTAGPFSVTFRKTKVAPSGDPHDYVSQAPYWWADPSKPDGKPYIRKDGERNPEIYLLHDDTQLGELCQSVKKLATAYYFTGKEEYALKAAALMQVWFIDAGTRMNPNLNYAQYVPGVNDGRGTGIIESRALANIPDAMAMMQDSKSIGSTLQTGVKTWFADYAHWLQTSKGGIDEHNALNNHGTIYDMQLIDYALFTGNTQVARQILKQTITRMDTQFTLDGRQPLELARTKSWGYCCMNLDGWCKLAVLAQHLDVDLWHTQTKDGKGIEKCIEWMMPYLLKQKTWAYKQIEPISYNEMLTICYLANGHYPGIDFKKVFEQYAEPKPWM